MTLTVLIYVYLLFMALGLLFALVNLYHIVRHGHLDSKSYFVTGAFAAGMVLILFVSATFMFTVDWSAPFTLLGGGSTNLITPPSSQF